MTAIQLFWFSVAIVCFFYADELYELVFALGLRLKLFFLNLTLRVWSYWIYLKLSRDLKMMNLPVPAFNFIPIQDRKNG